ncbi:hypothetical protein [Nitrobacter winogradskyi]|uniref:Uncharacterized protein n=2 Tax=Nitrobacter winogradskyi TaxID=913 RepID=A0ACC6AIG7_NITWI|nr:hypothetical protein [Nitrobacter winogradskyi]MCP1998780.1 hypothetical protein [Nitrobacter winogradskyi]GEC14296.1 hypothetical protein NWI01_01880 [Nitrobacter winogradskyi]
MRVSLKIDGDASGAVQAATDTSHAVVDLDKAVAAVSKKIVDSFEKASGAAGKAIQGIGEAAGVANDNAIDKISGVTQKVAQLTAGVFGAESAFGKLTAGTASVISGFGAVVRAATPIALISGIVGLVTSAMSTLHSIMSTGAQTSQRDLDEQARLIGVVRDAYRDASRAAGEFFEQSKAVTQLQLSQSTIALRSDLQRQVASAVGGFFENYAIAGLSKLGSPFADDSELRNIETLKSSVAALNAAIASGSTDVRKYVDEIAEIGNAAAATNPKLAKAASDIVKAFSSATADQNRIAQNEAALAQLNGTATETQKRLLGISTATREAGENFDRYLKSVDRRSAAMEAEATALGGSTGAMEKFRTQVVLTESAHQAGAGVAEKYAAAIAKISARAGEASQKLAVARIESAATFQLQQLGRNSIDQSVAGQLDGAFGDQLDMNGSTAQLVRFTERMKELKATTLELTQGIFRDFRNEIANGATAWEAFGRAGSNAVQRVADKIADKALDSLVSNMFGSFLGGGTSGGAGGLIGRLFMAAGGGTFGPGWGVVGEEGPELIRVFNGGVTVYPNDVSKPYLPGFAQGGTLSPLGNVTRLPRGGQDNSPAMASPMAISVNVAGARGNQEIHDMVAAGVASGIRQFAGSRQFDVQTQASIRKALARGNGNLARGAGVG